MDPLRNALNAAAEETLDPADWTELQALSHQIVDDAVDYLATFATAPCGRTCPRT